VTKQREPETGQHSLLFQVDYPEIGDGVRPRHRFMSAYEQHVEAPDKVCMPHHNAAQYGNSLIGIFMYRAGSTS
jgi:hypothetical protein